MTTPIDISEIKRRRELPTADAPVSPKEWQATAAKAIAVQIPCGSPPLKRFVPGSPKMRYTHETMDPQKYNYDLGNILLKRASGDAEAKKS